jgi:DHA1 family tetracycline resistance protein-like MFS transporter
MKRPSSRAFPVILTAVFLDLISNGILIPIVPQLLANPASKYYLLPASIPVSYSYVLLGILIAVAPIIMFFATPILGEYSDHIGRRKIMTWSLAGTALSYVVFAGGVLGKSLSLLFLSRVILGVSGGNISVAQAAIADITPAKDRTARFGLISAAYGVGFILGPVLGGLLSDPGLVSWFDAATPFWFAAILTAVNAFLVYLLMGETRPESDEVSVAWDRSIRHVMRAYAMKSLRVIFLTNFLFQGAIALFATFFSVFLIHNFGYDQLSVGYYIAYAGIWLIVAQGALLRPLSRRFDEVGLLRFFLLTGALSILAYYIPEHTIGLLVVGAFFAITNGITMAALPSLASQRASAQSQGEVLGINASVQALAQAVPPMLAGFLAAEISPSAPVYIAGIAIGVAWVIFIVFVRRK